MYGRVHGGKGWGALWFDLGFLLGGWEGIFWEGSRSCVAGDRSASCYPPTARGIWRAEISGVRPRCAEKGNASEGQGAGLVQRADLQ